MNIWSCVLAMSYSYFYLAIRLGGLRFCSSPWMETREPIKIMNGRMDIILKKRRERHLLPQRPIPIVEGTGKYYRLKFDDHTVSNMSSVFT